MVECVVGLKVKYFQNNQFEAYNQRFESLKYHPYDIDSSTYIHAATYEFKKAVRAQQCLWELIYLFGTDSWYENSEIIVHVEKPLRHVNRTDVFTLEGFGSYIFATEENLDERGSIYPFKYFQDPGFK
jgi:hypothetical protein